ncbi:MAG: FkbM family methyltransferase [Sneathiellaceae bacterium]
MTLRHPNPTPRFAARLGDFLAGEAQKLVMIDIGSRNGFDPIWRPLAPAARFIGFEADPAEAQRQNEANAAQGLPVRHYPHALGDRDGPRDFHVAKFAQCSSFYDRNPDWVGRFPITEQDSTRVVTLDTLTLDSFAAREGIPRIDFVKIDVEGAELDILEGARHCLADGGMLGIKTEFWWDPPVKRDYRGSFAAIDSLIRSHGFRFFDMKLHYYPRSTIPSGRLTGRFDNPEAKARLKFRHVEYGQAWTGDALYFRDPVGERIAGGAGPDVWPADRLLRLCALLDIHDYGDAAIEILEHFADRLPGDLDALYDLLTPTLDGEILPYDAYLEISAAHRQAYRKTWLEMTDWAPGPTRYRRKQAPGR